MAADDPAEANLEEIVAERVSDLRWTKTAYFNMGTRVGKISDFFDGVVLLSTGGLTTVLYQGWLSVRAQLVLAAIATTMSLVGVVWNLDTRAYKYKKIGEQYNSLLKEFEEYYELVLLDDSLSIDEKENRLTRLTERHRQLNNMTPPTSDRVFKKISEDDLGGTKEFDEFR